MEPIHMALLTSYFQYLYVSFNYPISFEISLGHEVFKQKGNFFSTEAYVPIQELIKTLVAPQPIDLFGIHYCLRTEAKSKT